MSVGWGVAGCGWVARAYVLPAIRACPSGRVAALLDPDPAALSAASALAPRARATIDLGMFLETKGLDAVYVAAPNDQHAPLVAAAAAAGKHVLCEKPMSADAADAAGMLATCAGAGVRYATAFDQRFHPAHVAVRRLVEHGRLGAVTAIRIHYACWTPREWRPPLSTPRTGNWRAEPQRAGGGALIDLAPHGLNLTEYLLGEPLVELAALVQRRVHDYPVDDGAVLIGRTAGQVLTSIAVAYNCPESLPRRRLEIDGTRGRAVAVDTMGQEPGGRLTLVDGRTGWARVVPFDTATGPFTAQLRAYTDALAGKRSWPARPEDDVRLVAMLAGASSAASGAASGAARCP